MIFVTQGHEKSVGLEVFLKSFLLLSPQDKSFFTLIGKKESIKQTLASLKINFEIGQDKILIQNQSLSCHFIGPSPHSQSMECLLLGMELAKNQTLITMPTSKDQLTLGKKTYLGHTEFFRSFYKKKYLPMCFYNERASILLVSDHLPLSKVPSFVKKEVIFEKVTIFLKEQKKIGLNINQVLLAGLNPHSGEGGLLGKEDSSIHNAIKLLKSSHKKIDFQGPISGDALFHSFNDAKKQLLVYMYHDQGLTLFKGMHQFHGINIALGLPFLRLSVDHGTAFSLYRKNLANYNGCFYMLKKAISYHRGNGHEH